MPASQKSTAVAPSLSWPSPTLRSHQIRSRLLYRLGVVSTRKSHADHGIDAVSQRNMSYLSRRPKILPVSEPLKYNCLEDDEETTRGVLVDATNKYLNEKSKCDEDEGKSKKKSVLRRPPSSIAVAFCPDVSVVLIPKHQEYSQRMRCRLWCDKKELLQMVYKNTLEYQYEGMEWRKVLEERQMYSMQGEYIHPVHCQPMLRNYVSWRTRTASSVHPDALLLTRGEKDEDA